jgi:hypothetical protein
VAQVVLAVTRHQQAVFRQRSNHTPPRKAVL